MSVRTPRRRFAAPFVVTLAACGGPSTPPVEPVRENPPAPQPDPSAGEPTPPADTTVAMPDQPAPAPVDSKPPISKNPPTPHKNPPPPRPEPVPPKVEPAKFEHRWSVTKIKGKDDCQAYLDPNCPKPVAGKPVATCNPPPPYKYACPAGLEDGESMQIVLRVGATQCFAELPFECPAPVAGKPQKTCNPPGPTKVACPTR